MPSLSTNSSLIDPSLLPGYPGISLNSPLHGPFAQEFRGSVAAEMEYCSWLNAQKFAALNKQYPGSESIDTRSQQVQDLLDDELCYYISRHSSAAKQIAAPALPWMTEYCKQADFPLVGIAAIHAILQDLDQRLRSVEPITLRSIEQSLIDFDLTAPLSVRTITSTNPEVVRMGNKELHCQDRERGIVALALVEGLSGHLRAFQECQALGQSDSSALRTMEQVEIREHQHFATNKNAVAMTGESFLREFTRFDLGHRYLEKRLPLATTKLAASWERFQLAVAVQNEFVAGASAFLGSTGSDNPIKFREKFYLNPAMSDNGRRSFDNVCEKELGTLASQLTLHYAYDPDVILRLANGRPPKTT